jgi:FtsH-binding integral membrane protein
MVSERKNVETSPVEQQRTDVRNTYRYLRLGLVALALLLAVAVVLQIGKSGCYQTSISAYYYTPVRSAFVAVLCAVGACMIIYQGSTNTEDVLLNFTGAAAFVIALVPTTVDNSCTGSSNIPSGQEISDAASNNVWALLVAGAIGVAAAWRFNRATFAFGRWSKWAKFWLVLTTGLMLAGVGVFLFDRPAFVAHAHLAAASALFVGLILVAAASFFAFRDAERAGSLRGQSKNPYALLAFLLLASGAGIGGVHLVDEYGTHWHWAHWLFWLEAAVIGEFVAYWVVQSAHLWDTETPSTIWVDAAPDGLGGSAGPSRPRSPHR